MLGRKQSIKQENILADYGNEEMLNENADVEWVNKVRDFQDTPSSRFLKIFNFFSAMGSSFDEILCFGVTFLSVSQHPKNL